MMTELEHLTSIKPVPGILLNLQVALAPAGWPQYETLELQKSYISPFLVALVTPSMTSCSHDYPSTVRARIILRPSRTNDPRTSLSLEMIGQRTSQSVTARSALPNSSPFRRTSITFGRC